MENINYFNLESFIINNKVFYEIVSKKGSIFNLIKEIDNDDLSFLEQYKDIKYTNLVSNCSEYLERYCKLNNKKLNQSIENISYCLLLFLLILIYEQHIESYTYEKLKLKILSNIINFDLNEINEFQLNDWFRISKLIKKKYILLEKDYEEIKERKDISFLTYTNFAYINYTKNLILSLKKCNFPLKLKIYCIDEKSYNILYNFSNNIILELLNDETNSREYTVNYFKEGWNYMMLSKIKCIHKELLNFKYVLYTDTDIVFDNNYLLKYLINNIYDHDLLVQNNGDKEFCAGFMFFQSNSKLINLFNIDNICLEDFQCDQPYINSKKDILNYRVLPQELFPVGKFYYNYNENINPWIIHFNWVRGNKKIDKMKKYNKWFNTHSFHLLIVTVGRESLIMMLNSIIMQLKETDYITIVYDNKDVANTFNKVKNLKTKCQLNVIMNNETYNIEAPQHAIRNKYNTLKGDFILHADDDDIYLPDAMSHIRKYVCNPSTLYIFNTYYRINDKHFKSETFYKKKLELNNIGTQSGVIPHEINKLGIWGDRYEGDYDFYKSIEDKVYRIQYQDEIIQKMRPIINTDESYIINVSIVGCGFVSYYYYVSMKNYDNIQLVGVYDHNKEKRDILAKECNCKSYESFEALLNDDCDMVINLTNPKSHYELNKKILRNKKHLYCEKPITLSINELNHLNEISYLNNVSILSATANYLSGYCFELKKLLKEKIIGKIIKVESNIIEDSFQEHHKLKNKLNQYWPVDDEINTGCNLEHCGYILSLITSLFGNIIEIKENHYISSDIIVNDKVIKNNTPNYYKSELLLQNNINLQIINAISNPLNMNEEDFNKKKSSKKTIITGEKGQIILDNIWDYNSRIFIIKNGKKDELIYSDDRFEQEWCLYMDLMRPISYFKKKKNSVMKINQIRHILEVILSIQDNTIGKITNFF